MPFILVKGIEHVAFVRIADQFDIFLRYAVNANILFFKEDIVTLIEGHER